MDDVLTWAGLAKLLQAKGRGSGYQLATKLGMNPSQFYRSLKTTREMTERQARTAREFLGQPMEAPPALPNRADRRRLEVFAFPAPADRDMVDLSRPDAERLELPMGLELGPGDYFVVRPISSASSPRIRPGEVLVVRRDYPPAHENDVVLEFTDGSGLVGTYKGQQGGHVHVEQFNPPKVLSFQATKVRTLHAVAFRL